jgi:competence protein ComEC
VPLLWLSLAFVCGVILGEWLGWPSSVWLALALCAAGLGLLGWATRRLLQKSPAAGLRIARLRERLPAIPAILRAPLPYAALLAALCLGAMRYQLSLPEIAPGHIAWYNDQESKFTIEGLVEAPPDVRDEYTNLRVRAEQLHPADSLLFTPVSGDLLARVPPGGGWRYGDRVRLWGYLETPGENETFSYRDYLAHQGIHSVLDCGACLTCEYARQDCARLLGRDQGNPLLGRIYALRERSLALIYDLFPDPEASLLAGILLGVESGIPQEVEEAFIVTGTAHIIAISGFNFAIIAGLLATTFGRWLGRWRGMLAALLGIVFYAVFVGGGAAVVRAAIMGGFAVFARQIGRRQNGLNTLAFIAALMALANPHVLWDVGFQLSFAATLGLVLYAAPLTQAFTAFASRHVRPERAERLAGPVGEYLLFTLAAQLTTLPVALYHFRRLSLVSLVANPLILPAQSPIMILGGAALLLGLLFQPLGQLAAYLVWPFVVYTIRVVEWLAGRPLATLSVEIGLLAVIAFYLLLFAVTFAGVQLRAGWRRLSAGLPAVAGGALLALGLMAVLVWNAALSAPDGRLHLTVLDVGSGDALLVQTPGGRYLLIDGGSSPSRLSDALGRRLPLAQRRLDYLVVAAAGDEQIGALPAALERFPPANVLWAGPPAGTFNARALRRNLTEMNIPIQAAQAGRALDLGQGARLRVLALESKGAVLSLEWRNFRALLPIGLEFEGMERLLVEPSLGAQTALLLAESGYAPLNPPEWIEKWQPGVILLSVAAGDPDGRPDPETLEAAQGYTLLRTDLNGWIHLNTDGERMWVEVERR